jgi:hypothetical protein
VLSLAVIARLLAADADPPHGRGFEYATIRWDGPENTHIVRPSGTVEFVSQLRTFKKPSRTDDRAFYMNIVMNALGKEGYEFIGMSSDEIVMRRSAGR